MKSRYEAVQGLIQLAIADYQDSETTDAVLKSYTAGEHAIVMALLVVASEIAALTDTIRKEGEAWQL